MPPGKEGKIELAVEHTEGYVGEVAKSANVTTNDPKMASFTLMLRARFKSNQPPAGTTVAPPRPRGNGALVVEPVNRWVTSALSGTVSATTLYLINDQPKPVHIKQVIPGGTSFTAQVTPIQDGRRYELRIQTTPQLKPGHYSQVVRVVTDNETNPEVTIDLDANVYAKVFATPTAIMMPTLPHSELASINWPIIYVRKVRDAGLQIKKCSSTLPFLRMEVLNDADGQVYRVKLTVDPAKATKGEYKGTITIETNDPEVPVIEIPIKGFFS